jgi:glycosyltransferase involved in cell wall biosynthesis
MHPGNRLRILHIVSGDLWAGAEAMVYQLLAGLNRLGSIDLHLIILNEGHLEQACKKLGVKCYLVDEQKLPAVALAGKAIRIARKIKPDIVHAHRYKENILAALVARFCGRPKLVATQHGRTETGSEPFHKRIVGKLNNACLQRIFEEVVAVSGDTSDYLLQSCGLKENKICIIPNGIEPPLTPLAVKDNGSDRPFTIGSAGRLFPVKRFDTFIEIARQVCRQKKQMRFVIAGEGPERQKLETLIAEYGLTGQVHLMGHVDHMQEFYNRLDLYTNTSMHEGTPMSILEAMANKLPIIAFDVAGLREIITNNADGFTIPQGDNAQFVSRIVELMDRPKQLKAFGEAARQTIIDRFSNDKMVEGYQKLYQEISRQD